MAIFHAKPELRKNCNIKFR